MWLVAKDFVDRLCAFTLDYVALAQTNYVSYLLRICFECRELHRPNWARNSTQGPRRGPQEEPHVLGIPASGRHLARFMLRHSDHGVWSINTACLW